MLGHGPCGMIQVYNRYRHRRKATEALQRWSHHLLEMVRMNVEPIQPELPYQSPIAPPSTDKPADALPYAWWSPRRPPREEV